MKNFIKKKTKLKKQNNNSQSQLIFKESEELIKDYENILCIISSDSNNSNIYDYFTSTDLLYFLKENQLDYNLFHACIKKQKMDCLE